MSVPENIRDARMVLNALPGIGPVTCRRLADAFGDDPRGFFRASRSELLAVRGVGDTIADTLLEWERHFDLPLERERTAQRGLRFVTPEDGDAYPPLLREIYDPPLGLYTAGAYRWKQRCVALVGTRHISAYGKQVARTLARELALRGWCVASGLARGVDAAAHAGALEAGANAPGGTAAVLGNGADIAYPPENLELFREITARGAVMTEFVLGRKADRQTFPMRNRIVSGMSRAAVVIESDIGGGSMITARFAGEQGRQVCAIPGRIDSPASRGCHALVRDGATLVTCVDDILEAAGEFCQQDLPLEENSGTGNAKDIGNSTGANANRGGNTGSAKAVRGGIEGKILECLTGGTTLSVDALAERTGLTVPRLTSTLLMMELDRLVAKQPDASYGAGDAA